MQNVPGRPKNKPAGLCPFCLKNKKLEGEILAHWWLIGYAVQVAPDMVLICPTRHVERPWGSFLFGLFSNFIAKKVVRQLGWSDFNISYNGGKMAGRKLWHCHWKMQNRERDNEMTAGLGLDGLRAKLSSMLDKSWT